MSMFDDYFGSQRRSSVDDFASALNDIVNKGKKPTTPAPDTRTLMQRRRECEANGHRYQVHGKISPTKIACSRCEVTWGIGPKTEPAS